MATLDGFNAETVEPMGSFDPIPAGDYRAMASASEMKPTKTGNGEYLQITWELIDAPYQGRKIWSRLNLSNPNTQTVEIAQRELSSICRAVGVLRPKMSEELHGRPIVLKIGTEVRKDNGETTNRIKGYAAVGAAAPPSSGPGTQAVAPVPAPAAAPSAPPWRR